MNPSETCACDHPTRHHDCDGCFAVGCECTAWYGNTIALGRPPSVITGAPPTHTDAYIDVDAAALKTVLERQRQANASWLATYERMSAHILAIEERLILAREALVATGYFTAKQVGDDIAPRITELWIALSESDA